MKYKIVKTKYNFWVAVIVVIIFLSLLGVFFQSQSTPLDTYQGETVQEDSTQEEETISLNTVQSSKINCSIGIPDDNWTKVTKSGHETWIHTSGTAVQLQVTDFDYSYLSANEGSEMTNLSIDGYTLASFSWTSTTSYVEAYQDNDFSYMVLVSFDKTHTLKAIITIPNDCYSTMEKQVTSIFDSIKWEKEDPFPNDMAIYYSETGTFYYGLPSSWQLAVDTNVVSAQDSESGSIISVSAVKSETTYEKMTKVDYVSYASSNRTSFSLSSYEADKKTIKAISTYYSGTNSMVLFQYLVASGKYEYAITIEAYSDNYEDANKIFENAIDSFHYYK